jgi:hypothetical protein
VITIMARLRAAGRSLREIARELQSNKDRTHARESQNNRGNHRTPEGDRMKSRRGAVTLRPMGNKIGFDFLQETSIDFGR